MNNLEELNKINESYNQALLDYFHKHKNKIMLMKDIKSEYTNSPYAALFEGNSNARWNKKYMYGKVIGWNDEEKTKRPLIRGISLQFFQEKFDRKWSEEKVCVKLNTWSGYTTLSILTDPTFGGFVDDETTLPKFVLDSFYNDTTNMNSAYVISFEQFNNNERPWLENNNKN